MCTYIYKHTYICICIPLPMDREHPRINRGWRVQRRAPGVPLDMRARRRLPLPVSTHHRPSTLNSKPYILYPEPSTLKPKP